MNQDENIMDINIAFQYGMALGFAKKHDEMDKVLEEVKKAIEEAIFTKEKNTNNVGKLIVIKNKFGQYMIKCDKCEYTEPMYSTFIRNFCPCCGIKLEDESRPKETEHSDIVAEAREILGLDCIPESYQKELDILYDYWFKKVFGVDPKQFKKEEE